VQQAKPVTVVTGASKGIGRYLVQQYLSLGHSVVGFSRSTAELNDQSYTHFALDVADEARVREAFQHVWTQHGRLDHLINNAGIASMNHALLTPGATVERILRTNVLGSFVVAREAAKLMQRGRFGRIVNFSTVAVPLALAGEAAYVASKAAVEGLTRSLAREFAPFGIRINAVGPTPIDTDLIRNVPRDKIDALLKQQAIGRLGRFEDVGNVVRFFLAPESEFITGQVVYLGGVS
jgi:3-oxoacyl-[acyl-carrier protein] reductase